MGNLFITVSVAIRKERYAFQGKSETELVMEVPAEVIEKLDYGNLVDALVSSALDKLNAPEEKVEE